MNSPIFDITGSPPTLEQVEQWRTKALNNTYKIQAHQEMLCWFGVALVVIVSIISAVLLHAHSYNPADAKHVFALMGMYGFVLPLVGRSRWPGHIMILVIAVSHIWTAYAFIALPPTPENAPLQFFQGMLIVPAAIIGMTLAVLFCVLSSIALKRFIVVPCKKSNQLLDDLTELSPEKHPKGCLKYFEWGQQDKTLLSYQHLLFAQGRNPVMAEYKAAKQWIKSEEKDRAAEEDIIKQAQSAWQSLQQA